MKSVLFILIFLFSNLVTHAQEVKKITITNPLPVERKDELVLLSEKFLTQKIGNIANTKFIQLTTGNNQPIVVQLDDMDSDGHWDEAVFLYSFKPKEKAVFNIKITDAPATIKAVVRAHVRHMHKNPDNSFGPSVPNDTMPYNNPPTDFSKQKLPPYLTEGPAWENDKVGFRKYFDTRNTNDIWGKLTDKMVLDKVGADPSVIYHNLDWWGMDILKVGKSLGAGAIALQVKLGNGKDSLVRPGLNVKQITYEQIADGPVRAVFKIKYKGWQIATGIEPVNLTEQISIWGGQFFYENKIIIENPPSASRLVTGTINFFSKTFHQVDTLGLKGLYTYDVQSENKDKLGLAITVPAKQFISFGTTADSNSDVLNTYKVEMKIDKSMPVIYRFYSCWEKSDLIFADEKGFASYIGDQLNRQAHPLILK